MNPVAFELVTLRVNSAWIFKNNMVFFTIYYDAELEINHFISIF